MRFVDHTFDLPEENLACDEVLLDFAGGQPQAECLRIWEPRSHFVVVGYTNELTREVNLAACTAAGIPVVRRCSGGGTVLQGPGCLNYALVLSINRDPALQTISGSNTAILSRHVDALRRLLPTAPCMQGHTDLVLNDRKFSGNSQRRRGQYLLFHGTFLYNFAIEQIERFLPLPSIEPAYRQNRPHASFVGNIDISREDLVALLRKTWNAHTDWKEIPFDRIAALGREKYRTQEWTYRR